MAAQARSDHRRNVRVLCQREDGDDNSGLFRAAKRRFVPRRSSTSFEGRADAGGGEPPTRALRSRAKVPTKSRKFLEAWGFFRSNPCAPKLPGDRAQHSAPCKTQCRVTIQWLASASALARSLRSAGLREAVREVLRLKELRAWICPARRAAPILWHIPTAHTGTKPAAPHSPPLTTHRVRHTVVRRIA